MEKEFVPYEQSLALKELGFDEPCFGIYYGKSNLKLFQDCFWGERTNSKFLSFFEDRDEFCTAINYQQAFRFFREKYGYDVSIKKCTSTQYKFVITQSFVENDYYFIDYPFPSHENAELECLKKLKEIVKRKIV